MGPSRQPELYVAALIPYTAATCALVLRLVARRNTKVRLGWDDYLSVAAFLIGTGFTFISLFKMRWGLGLKMADVDLPASVINRDYYLDLWVDEWLYTFSVGLSKFVILGLYWRMFGLSIIRQPIRILFGLSFCWIVMRLTLTLAVCQPIHKFWDKDIPGNCPLPANLSLFGSMIPHVLIELAILICPMIEINRLQLKRQQKIAVGMMFTSGLLVCGSALASMIVTIKLDPNSTDVTWDGMDNQIWAVCDVNLAHFSTSLPLLRPALRSFSGFLSTKLSNTMRSTTAIRTKGTMGFRSNHTARRIDSDSTHELDPGCDSNSEGDVSSPYGKTSTKVIALQQFAPSLYNEPNAINVSVKTEFSSSKA